MSQPLSRLSAADATKRRLLAMSLSAVPLVMLSACGGSGDDTAATPTTSQETSSTDTATSGSTDASSDSSSAQVLTGTVGKGDAYVITLDDSAGAPVRSLKAGAYEVKIKDESGIHDFHLTGPGVDESTSVPETTSVTWSVDLKKGSYTFVCDPHAQSMTGSFTVS